MHTADKYTLASLFDQISKMEAAADGSLALISSLMDCDADIILLKAASKLNRRLEKILVKLTKQLDKQLDKHPDVDVYFRTRNPNDTHLN